LILVLKKNGRRRKKESGKKKKPPETPRRYPPFSPLDPSQYKIKINKEHGGVGWVL